MKEKFEQLQIETSEISREEKEKYYVGFNCLDIKPIFKSKLFEYFNYDIKKTFNCSKEDLLKFSEYFEISIPRDFLKKRDSLNLDEIYEQNFNNTGIKLLIFEDEKYPRLLKEIPDFPLSLFYKGNLENINDNFNLAVVGSRSATQNAKIALENIIQGFYNTDITIVSGLAYGVDATAHKSAVDNNLKTIGVIGTGLDIIYPSANKFLYEKIIDGAGVIFSEYPVKIQALPRNFPQRNRIVVGMSKGTLVAEAQLKSGAMISANLALDYNRELMCIPGNITNPNTQGIYHLIKNGAGIITSADDILSQMNWEIKKEENNKNISNLSEQQKKILEIIACEEKGFDEIINITQADVGELMVSLTELELQGLIKQSNNKYYKS